METKRLTPDELVAKLAAMEDADLLAVRFGRLLVVQDEQARWCLRDGADEFSCDSRDEAISALVLAATSRRGGAAWLIGKEVR